MALQTLVVPLLLLLTTTWLAQQAESSSPAGRVNNDSQVASLVELSIEQQQAWQKSSSARARRHAQQLHLRGHAAQAGKSSFLAL